MCSARDNFPQPAKNWQERSIQSHLKALIISILSQLSNQIQLADPSVGAQFRCDQIGHHGVAECQPAALGDPVGLVLKFLGHDRGKVLENRGLDQLRVNRSNTIHRVAAH